MSCARFVCLVSLSLWEVFDLAAQRTLRAASYWSRHADASHLMATAVTGEVLNHVRNLPRCIDTVLVVVSAAFCNARLHGCKLVYLSADAYCIVHIASMRLLNVQCKSLVAQATCISSSHPRMRNSLNVPLPSMFCMHTLVACIHVPRG